MKRWAAMSIAALIASCTPQRSLEGPHSRSEHTLPTIEISLPVFVIDYERIQLPPSEPVVIASMDNPEYACSFGTLAFGTPHKSAIVRNSHTSKLRVLKKTEMPSVLIEVLQVTNDESARFYNHPCNASRIAARIADGVLAYQRGHPDLKAVVIDDGHGAATGHVNERLGIHESTITHNVQSELVRMLSSSLNVYALNHPGPERQGNLKQAGRRLDMYVDSANAIHRRENAIYLSIHANYIPEDDSSLYPPQMHITPAASERTGVLAKMLASETNMLFCGVWPDRCTYDAVALTSSTGINSMARPAR